MITPKVITAPTVEPISVSDAKDALNIDFTDRDALIYSYIRAARAYFEARTGRTIHETTFEYYLDAFPSSTCPIFLPRAAPLIDVNHVKYKLTGGSESTWGTSSYIVDTANEIGSIMPIYNGDYPLDELYPMNGVRIRYRAGIVNASIQTWADESIQQAIRLLVGGMWENRESEVITDRASIDVLSMKYGAEAFIGMNTVEFRY